MVQTKIRAAMWAQENDAPAVSQTEEEVLVPKPVERYSVPEAKIKAEKKASQRNRKVTRGRPSLFKKVVAGFIKLQKQPTKSSRKLWDISRRD